MGLGSGVMVRVGLGLVVAHLPVRSAVDARNGAGRLSSLHGTLGEVDRHLGDVRVKGEG